MDNIRIFGSSLIGLAGASLAIVAYRTSDFKLMSLALVLASASAVVLLLRRLKLAKRKGSGTMHLLAICVCLLSVATLAAAERGFVPVRRAAGDHVALVIGNGAYPDVPLANPVNDAVDVGRAFESIGFQVTVVNDADKAQMLHAIQTFGDRLAKAKAAVFYYAGHGVQVGGSNWLLPVARQVGEIINREDEVRLRAVDANEVLVAMERAKVPVAMVILDACRNNPFKGAGRSGAKGLAQLDAPPGSLVVYATAPGQVAADGNGRNSPFSQAFVTQLLIPGLEVEAMLRNVKKGVRETTQGVQVPWSSSSMTDTFTFVPAISQDEEMSMKQAQLAGLTQRAEAIAKAEAVADEKRKIEAAALAAKQAEVDKLNAQIEDMKKKVNSGDPAGAQPGDGGGLKAMLAVVRQKEAQQKELVEMQQKAEAARQAREAEIARMKAKEAQESRDREQKRLAELASDLKDYREIAGSEFGKDMAQIAWDEVLKKWGAKAGSIQRDDVASLQAMVAPAIGVERSATSLPGVKWNSLSIETTALGGEKVNFTVRIQLHKYYAASLQNASDINTIKSFIASQVSLRKIQDISPESIKQSIQMNLSSKIQSLSTRMHGGIEPLEFMEVVGLVKL